MNFKKKKVQLYRTISFKSARYPPMVGQFFNILRSSIISRYFITYFILFKISTIHGVWQLAEKTTCMETKEDNIIVNPSRSPWNAPLSPRPKRKERMLKQKY